MHAFKKSRQAMTDDKPEILNEREFDDGHVHGSYNDSDMKVPETKMDTRYTQAGLSILYW